VSTDPNSVIDVYERHAEAWVNDRLRANNFPERGWLDRFCALIPAGGSVLDIGCGAGEPIAKHLSESGYSVTGVDSSATMIAMFQARLPSQQALLSDMRTLCLEQRFHGILAWDSFFHLNHENQRRMFSIFRAHAAPHAALMFTCGTSYGEAIGRLHGEPLYHASLDTAEYLRLLNEHGFAVVATVSEDQTCGGRAVWLAQLQ
jgi:SAM-dependent methyltransferase